jgi:hypothetical protein
VLALDHDGAAIYNIVDDEPAPVREWLPVLANVLGAKPPRHVPRWLARLIAGEAQVMIATESRGASNAKAKSELGWTLRYPSWRQGFVARLRVNHPDGWTQISSGRLNESLDDLRVQVRLFLLRSPGRYGRRKRPTRNL